MHWALAGILVLILAGAVGCGGKSEEETAADLLEQALEAHVAGDLDEATDLYREVLVHDARNKFAFYNLGLIDQRSGSLESAETNYRQALETDPEFAPALFNLAILRENAGSTDEAVGLYKRAVDADPSFAAAHFNLGLLLKSEGQESDGDREIARAIELDPSLADRVPPEPEEAEEPSGP